MSPFLPFRPADLPGDPESTSIQDPRRETEQHRLRWEIRAAQWRALEIARSLWGEEVATSLSGYPARGGFHGLLELEVPHGGDFDLETHRELEARFIHIAGLDPLLARVPLVYIFGLADTLHPG